jgi:hypothetical protein
MKGTYTPQKRARLGYLARWGLGCCWGVRIEEGGLVWLLAVTLFI